MSKKIYDPLKDFDELAELFHYVDNFDMHYKLLLRRYERFKEVNDPMNTDIDVTTYLDMIVVQLRAMCIERPNLKKITPFRILPRNLVMMRLRNILTMN